MQRRQSSQFLNVLLHLLGDNDRAIKTVAALHHTVADSTNLGQIVDNLTLALGQSFFNLSKSLGLIFHHGIGSPSVAIGLVGEDTVIQTNTLANTLCQNDLAIHIDQLILQRRTTGVDNQNFHNFSISSLIL